MKFVRYGGLSSVVQKQYISDDEEKTFHNPPLKKGLYAFPYGYIEFYLLSGTLTPGHVSNKSYWLKDKNGNKIKSKDFFEYDKIKKELTIKKEWLPYLKYKKIKRSNIIKYGLYKDNVGYVAVLNKPRIFLYDGLLWHHLPVNDFIDKKGSWYLTNMKTYVKAFNNYKHKTLKEIHKIDKNLLKMNYDPFTGQSITFVKDDLEVFIEKIN